MVTELADDMKMITARKTAMPKGNTLSLACALAMGFMAGAAPIGAHAAESQLAITYEVEVGSLAAMRIAYKAALSADGYQSTASVKTRGLADLFSDYRMEMASAGGFAGGALKPSHYRSEQSNSKKKKVLEVRWRGDTPAVASTPKDKEDDALVSSGLTSGLVDPLSMLLRKAALQAGQPCPSVERVVDGREVYDLRFTLAGEVKLGSDNPGVYRGKAFKCSMTYTPVAGRPAVKFEKVGLQNLGRIRFGGLYNKDKILLDDEALAFEEAALFKKAGGAPSRFDIWFAPIGSADGDKALFVPVLATGKLQGMRFVAYAREASVDGRKLGQN